jgi:hypothetical protein
MILREKRGEKNINIGIVSNKIVNHLSILKLDRKRLNLRIFWNIKIIGIIFT